MPHPWEKPKRKTSDIRYLSERSRSRKSPAEGSEGSISPGVASWVAKIDIAHRVIMTDNLILQKPEVVDFRIIHGISVTGKYSACIYTERRPGNSSELNISYSYEEKIT